MRIFAEQNIQKAKLVNYFSPEREREREREVLARGDLKSQYRPTRKMFVSKIQVNPIHTILKYGD